MISLDKGLVGGKVFGDVVGRHKKYGEHVEALDIIVLCQRGYILKNLSAKVKAHPTNSSFRLWYYFDALRIGRIWFQSKKYDLIITQDPYLTGLVGLKLKKEFGAKLVIHFHGDFSINFFTKYLAEQADAIRVMSSGQKEKLIGTGIVADKIRIISTPVEVERFINFEALADARQKALLEELRRAANNSAILMVGRKNRAKGLSIMLSALRLIVQEPLGKSLKLWLVGDFGKAQVPKDLAQKVHVFGMIDSRDLPAYYLSSTLVVLPSLAESFGKVLVEANACGKPIIATATTGAREIIADGYNGFLVPLKKSGVLAQKILELFKNPELAKTMGQNGQELVRKKFDQNLAKIIDFWKEIAGKP